MHCDIHLRLHALRAGELWDEAAATHLVTPLSGGPAPGEPSGPQARGTLAQRPGPPSLRLRARSRVGWAMVEMGLRLVQPPRRRVRAALPRG
ncbi:hypothetical protein [Streptomyces zingiberis]|uniref:Uncharacterized protein n=1 Tax=Streptomyces zingiberis TaxID=2053010 RepID=A0ABX1BW00_9ACTN|nr:hypothetical protein [Streptomyces zingiberis]NJQ01836.1 hypothetical protein [Streptomyces zingiberis]